MITTDPEIASISPMASEAISLLTALIQTPSFSKEENQTANLISEWLSKSKVPHQRSIHNITIRNKFFDPAKPTILLNSHHDTVKPNSAYARDPFKADIEDGKLYGLGSNDAGASLVSLLLTFIHYYKRDDLKYNLIFAATAEEEISGPKGMRALREELPPIEFALVGEPTGMQLAIAEKGLLVIDAMATGSTGHAAHPNSDNALYKAIDDINWIRGYKFPKNSGSLGSVKMTVTQFKAGEQHNVIASEAGFVIDVRVNEHYTNQEVFNLIDKHTQSQLKARSFRLNSSFISPDHPIVLAGKALGRNTYGSPTLSDQALLNCPSLKVGPGDSNRSHQADEFIYLQEIEEGIDLYLQLLNHIL